MTRSVANAFQLHWWDSIHYHPFGLLLAGVMLLYASLLLLPPEKLVALRKWFNQRPDFWLAVYLGLISVFAIYGFIRMGWNFISPQTAAWMGGRM